MRRANYWVMTFNNAVWPSLYVATAAGFLAGLGLRSFLAFLVAFLIAMCICVPLIMWLYHSIIWPRRRRNGQTGRG